MRGPIIFLVFLQLVTFIFGQITFTREWVNGKRSDLTRSLVRPPIESDEDLQVSLINNGGHFNSEGRLSLSPAIDFLIMAEKVFQQRQNPQLSRYNFFEHPVFKRGGNKYKGSARNSIVDGEQEAERKIP